MGRHGEKGRSRFLKPPRFEHVFGELLRCARRSCAPRDPIGVAAPHHNTRPAPSHIPKPRLIVSTLAHSPALSNRTHIILSALRASLKFTARPPLAQGHDEPSMTERCEHFTSFSGVFPFKCYSSAGLGDTILCALARPRLHRPAPSTPSRHLSPQPREYMLFSDRPDLFSLCVLHRCSTGHGMRVHRQPQLFPALFRLGWLEGRLRWSEVPRGDALPTNCVLSVYAWGAGVQKHPVDVLGG